MTTAADSDRLTRRSFWAATAFYIVIGFEFLYMAGPFAAYFYSVYRPGLNFFNESPLLSWLTRFFMPHIATETSSLLINWHNALGVFFAVLGFTAFCAGAGQVYYHKLAKKGPVTRGVYRFIRHPQYVSFVVCGFGLLLLWPRYIVLLMFITMLFGYYWLAKIEERECESRYGQSYLNYKGTTSMFVPLSVALKGLPRLPVSGWRRRAATVLLYVMALAGGIAGAHMVESHSLNSLYTYSTSDSVTIAVVKIDREVLKAIVTKALSSDGVQKRLRERGQAGRYLNYVLPAEWFISEIPMQTREGFYHSQPGDYNRNFYKIIFTRADLRRAAYDGTEDFLHQVTRRVPVVEAWIDVARSTVTEVKDPPSAVKYQNIPVAIY